MGLGLSHRKANDLKELNPICFYCSNLAFRIVMDCGITHFGQRGKKQAIPTPLLTKMCDLSKQIVGLSG